MDNRLPVYSINTYLIIGMRPSIAGEAVTISNGQEIGTNCQTLSDKDADNPLDSPIASSKTHYLQSANFLFHGVDWSGNIAVTSPTGTYSLQNVDVYGSVGIRTAWTQATNNVSNAYYFGENSLTGLLMLDDVPNSTKGWEAPYNHSQLMNDLRKWREFIRNLPRDAFFFSGDATKPRDVINRNATDTNAGGKFIYDVAGMDINNDGFVVIDIQDDGTDFEINNSEWIIKNSNFKQQLKLVIFRIRGRTSMNINNAAIMTGEGLKSPGKLSVIFVKVYPEEEFTSVNGSSNQVFNANNIIINGVGFWDLNTIGDANTDTDYGPPTDLGVYLPGASSLHTTNYVKRNLQNKYTEIKISNGQGCGQFISPCVMLENVRFIRGSICTEKSKTTHEPKVKTSEEVMNDLLESIALEEAAVSNLINAEAEKIRWTLGRLPQKPDPKLNTKEIMAIQKQTERTMQAAIKFQMLLQFKLEAVLEAKMEVEIKSSKEYE